jgi:purine-nucleoside phosphorylase
MSYSNLPIPSSDNGLTRYLQEIRKFPILEPEEEYMLARSWAEHGDSVSAHKLVTSHLRLAAKIPNLNEQLNKFNHNGLKITNFEMETSALYALAGMLGHNACTVCAIIANRFKEEYSKDYKLTVDKLIKLVLSRLSK